MNLKERMDQFNKRWNITSADSHQEALNKFKTRILNIFKDVDQHVTEESVTTFCQYFGVTEEWQRGIYGDKEWGTNIIDRLDEENKIVEFYRLIELIFSLDIQTSTGFRGEEKYSRELLIEAVQQAIDFSDVNVAIVVSEGNVILYPRGEKKLDDELVNYVLTFLNDQSNKHFQQALKFYQSNNPVKSAESLRRSLEEFLRFKLQNTKGLDANIGDLQKKLKEDGRDSQVRNIIFTTFSYLDQYFNDNSKHNDGKIDPSENELLIYQTGLLMRYVNSCI